MIEFKWNVASLFDLLEHFKSIHVTNRLARVAMQHGLTDRVTTTLTHILSNETRTMVHYIRVAPLSFHTHFHEYIVSVVVAPMMLLKTIMLEVYWFCCCCFTIIILIFHYITVRCFIIHGSRVKLSTFNCFLVQEIFINRKAIECFYFLCKVIKITMKTKYCVSVENTFLGPVYNVPDSFFVSIYVYSTVNGCIEPINSFSLIKSQLCRRKSWRTHRHKSIAQITLTITTIPIIQLYSEDKTTNAD